MDIIVRDSECHWSYIFYVVVKMWHARCCTMDNGSHMSRRLEQLIVLSTSFSPSQNCSLLISASTSVVNSASSS